MLSCCCTYKGSSFLKCVGSILQRARSLWSKGRWKPYVWGWFWCITVTGISSGIREIDIWKDLDFRSNFPSWMSNAVIWHLRCSCFFFIWSVPDLCVFQLLPSCFKSRVIRFINFGWEIFFRYEKKLQFLFLLLSCGCSKGLCQWQWGEGKIILQICNCTQIHQPVTHCWANWI